MALVSTGVYLTIDELFTGVRTQLPVQFIMFRTKSRRRKNNRRSDLLPVLQRGSGGHVVSHRPGLY